MIKCIVRKYNVLITMVAMEKHFYIKLDCLIKFNVMKKYQCEDVDGGKGGGGVELLRS